MSRSSMMGLLVFVAVAAAPTYVMAETTTDKVAHRTPTAETKSTLKDELAYDSVGGEGSRVSTAASRARVMAMQQALKDSGFDPGPIDGTVGPRTAAALRRYQKGESSAQAGRRNPVAALLILSILFGDRQFPP